MSPTEPGVEVLHQQHFQNQEGGVVLNLRGGEKFQNSLTFGSNFGSRTGGRFIFLKIS